MRYLRAINAYGYRLIDRWRLNLWLAPGVCGLGIVICASAAVMAPLHIVGFAVLLTVAAGAITWLAYR